MISGICRTSAACRCWETTGAPVPAYADRLDSSRRQPATVSHLQPRGYYTTSAVGEPAPISICRSLRRSCSASACRCSNHSFRREMKDQLPSCTKIRSKLHLVVLVFRWHQYLHLSVNILTNAATFIFPAASFRSITRFITPVSANITRFPRTIRWLHTFSQTACTESDIRTSCPDRSDRVFRTMPEHHGRTPRQARRIRGVFVASHSSTLAFTRNHAVNRRHTVDGIVSTLQLKGKILP